MVALKIDRFGGLIPVLDDRLLPDTAAAHAENAWLSSGALIGLPTPKLIRTADSAAPKKLFRIPEDYNNIGVEAPSLWLEFDNPNTDVIRAPVFGDTHDRYYWASTTGAPQYNTRARIEDGLPSFLLGVPTPTSTPTVVPQSDGESEIVVTRSYVVTWMTAYGEEGAPSPAATASGKQDDTWTVVLPVAGVGDMSDRNLTHARVYRTVTSRAGGATFFLVAQLPIATETYPDNRTDTEISAGSRLQSATWTPPPEDLEGFVMMPNGIVAGWRENELWFSEPYRPHAWPAEYVHTVEYPIVGLGVVNQTLVACTNSFPMMATGSSPAGITTSKVAVREPCLSRQSIVSAPEGVYYASPNGLVRIAPGASDNITRIILTKEDWSRLTGLTELKAARLGMTYYAFGSDLFDDIGVLLDPASEQVIFTALASEDPTDAVFNDDWTGEVILVRGNQVYWLDQADATVAREPYLWRSKIFQMSQPLNLAAAKIQYRIPATTPPQSGQRDNSLEQDLSEGQYALFRVYADDRHILTWELRSPGELIRLPSGFKAEHWQFEVEGRVELTSLHVASTVQELSRV